MEGVLNLIELQIEGIRSISENQTIDFEKRSDLIQIDGLNKDTGGSSGAGKSTIAIAIDYLFGISSLAATVLKPWDESKTPKVKAKFTKNNKIIEITRSTKNGLSISVDGEETSGNSKQAEEKLDEIIGLPRDIFKRLIHKRQDDGSFFVKMTPKEKYEFLIKVLNLEEKNKDLKFIEEEYKGDIKDLDKLDTTMKLVEQSEQEIIDIINSKIKPECTIKEEYVISLEKSVDIKKEELLKIRSSFENEKSQIEKPVEVHLEQDGTRANELRRQAHAIQSNIKNITKEHRDKIDSVRSTIRANDQEIASVNLAKTQAQTVGKAIKDKRSEYDVLKHDATCNTCKQSWTGNGAEEKLKELDLEIKTLISQAIGFKSKIDTEQELIEKKNKLEEIDLKMSLQTPQSSEEAKLTPLNDLIAEEAAKLANQSQASKNVFLEAQNQYLSNISSIENKFKSQIDEMSSNINGLEQNKVLLSSQLNSYKIQISNFDKEMQSLHDKAGKKGTEVEQCLIEYNRLSQKIQISKESSRCLKSFILNTFQDTLTSIGDTATDIVNNIPNVATATIFFEGFKETAKGSIKNEISAVLSKSGVPDVPVKALCGGEGCAIGLAIDLAVIDIIESKANKGANFYIMDEPFNGLDSVCREDCLEIIKGLDSNKKIIIIDHCNEVKEMVSDVITVIKENEKSTII